MVLRTLPSVLIFCFATFGVAGLSFAQGLDYAYREAESLTDAQKLDRGSELIEKMKDTLRLALKRLESAKENKDIIQLNCLNEKLSAIKGLLKISEQADVSMRESLARKDLELANHEFTKISIAGVRIDNFRAGVEGCVGEASQYLGQTERVVDIDEDIRTDSPLNDVAAGLAPIPEGRPDPVSGSE